MYPKRVCGNIWKNLLIVAVILILFVVGLEIVIDQYPVVGAQSAKTLRAIFGDRFVAQMETFAFTAIDTFQRLEYKTGLKTPAAPWQVSAKEQITTQPAALAPKTAGALLATSHPSLLAVGSTPVPAPVVTRTLATHPPTQPAAVDWQPIAVKPFSDLPGEGIWMPYIQNSSRQVLAYKTFLSPDPDRPYTTVKVIAFNLAKTQLHFALGSEEPYESPKIPRAIGEIPPNDRQSDLLLAAFNGGFMVEHGHFGAMADGLVAVHPKAGLGTLAIYRDGSLRMGEWGTDLQPSEQMVAYRQNGPLAIKDGQISMLVATPTYWGYTISGDTVTWRSGIGLSQDGLTLYYLAGPSLTIQSLTDAMEAAGLWTAIQLDINKYWVHFVTFHPVNGQLTCVPLDENAMKVHANRFLIGYSHDFFYITAK